MISDEIWQKLQNIIRGDVLEGQEDHCTAIRNLLCQSFGSDPTVKKEFESRAVHKEKQNHFLKSIVNWLTQYNLRLFDKQRYRLCQIDISRWRFITTLGITTFVNFSLYLCYVACDAYKRPFTAVETISG
jgi:hypothetical protein